MRIGVVARAEDRGLGIQTWEVCRHLLPERVIVVDMGELAGPFKPHFDRYADFDHEVIPHFMLGDLTTVTRLLKDIDVVYTAETFYSWVFCDIARKLGVATVNHLNPEFFHHHRADNHDPAPTQWWAPSRWLRDDARMPTTVDMPMPCPLDRWPEPVPQYDGSQPLRVLHVAGHRAMGDRHGTRQLYAALRKITERVDVIVTTQDQSMPTPGGWPRNVSFRIARGITDYWRLYDGPDVVVLPRRYGGLCLPAIEAAGAGCALVMTDCSPNEEYPAERVSAREDEPIETKLGPTPAFSCHPDALAAAINGLAANPGLCQAIQITARHWAAERSWDALAGSWRANLAAAVRQART